MAGIGWSDQKIGEPCFDAVYGSNEEVAGPHRQVHTAEVEEAVRGRGFVSTIEMSSYSAEVVDQGRLEGVVEKVLDGERLGEVRACGLASAGAIVKINNSGMDEDLIGFLGRDVVAL